MKTNKKLEAVKKKRMQKLARDKLGKPIEFIFNGNYTNEEIHYFIEELEKLEKVKKRE